MLQLDTDGKSFDLEKNPNPNESNDPCFQTLHDSMRIQEPKYQTLPTPASWIDNTADMDPNVGVASPPWAELPADALSEIAGHLRDAGDLVRFLAVCRPWRGAPLPPRAPSFLPCLVEPSGVFDDPGVGLHTPLSARKTRFLLPLPALRG